MSKDNQRISNVETGMDINVVSYKEVSGPLGGISIEYQIKVETENKRRDFESSFRGETSKIDSFVVNKTFKEIEYFHNKIKTKHAENKNIPDLIVDNSPFVENKEMRLKAANNFLNFIAKDKVWSSSKLLYSFLGYDPDKRTEDENPSFPRVATIPEKIDSNKQKKADVRTKTTCISDEIFTGKNANDEMGDEEEEDDEDLFQEFKRQNVAATTFSESSSSLFTDSPLKTRQSEQYKDLFAFSRDDLPMEKNLVLEEKEQLVGKTKQPHLEELVDTAELLKIDDSLSDIWKEMQQSHHSKVKPEIKPKPMLAPKPSSLPRQISPPPTTTTSLNQNKPVPAPRTKPVPAPRLPDEEASAAHASTSSSSSSSSASGKNNVQKKLREKYPEAKTVVETEEEEEGRRKEKKLLEMCEITKESHSKDLSAFDILNYIDSEQQAHNKQTDDNLDLFS